MGTIKIAIAEDHTLLRNSLISYFERFPQIEVLWGVENGKELLEKLESERPDIILLDIDMPVMNGCETLKKLRIKHPQIGVIMLSMHYDYIFVKEFISMGAGSFLPKNCRMEKLLEAINAVFVNGKYYDEHIIKILEEVKTREVSPLNSPTPIKITLTEREVRIIELLRANKSNKEIADLLCISLRTLEGNRSELMQKTGCKNLAALVTYAVENALVPTKPIRFYESFLRNIRKKLKRKVT